MAKYKIVSNATMNRIPMYNVGDIVDGIVDPNNSANIRIMNNAELTKKLN